MRSLLVRLFNKMNAPVLSAMKRLEGEIEVNRILLAQSRIREFNQIARLDRLSDSEFKVFSQWGEDGIIQYLLSKVPVVNDVFVEFGVQDYTESNTRFLLVNNNWKGLIIDSSNRNIQTIRSRPDYWRHDLTAVCEFITRENINTLIQDAGITGDIGLLSIDIDGNDYWVWQAINIISPRIVVIEYNSTFGNRQAVAIPYNPRFDRTLAHYSNLYFGASLLAICKLAEEKGYVFAGSNSIGSNAFFVRKDVAGNVTSIEPQRGFIESKLRESRDQQGKLTFLSGKERLAMVANMELVDVSSGKILLVRDLRI